jgi:hypothetical protein
MEDKIKKIYKVVTETPKLKDAFTGITEDQFRTALQDEKAQDALYDDLVAYDLVTKGDPNEFWTNKGLRQPKVATPPVPQPPAVSLAPPQRQSIEQQAAGQATGFVPPMAVQPEQPVFQPFVQFKNEAELQQTAKSPVFKDYSAASAVIADREKMDESNPLFAQADARGVNYVYDENGNGEPIGEYANKDIADAVRSQRSAAPSGLIMPFKDAETDFAKMSPEQQAQAIAGSTGGQLAESKKPKPTLLQQGKQAISDIASSFNRSVFKAPSAIAKTVSELGTGAYNLMGGDAKVEQDYLYQIADKYDKWIDDSEFAKQFIGDKNVNSLAGDVGSGLGQIATMITAGGGSVAQGLKSAPSLLRGVAEKFLTPASGVAFSQVFSSEYDNMKAKGESDNTALKQALANAFVSAPLESIPLINLTERMNAINPSLARKVINTLAQGFDEMTQERLQQAFSNVTNNQLAQLESSIVKWSEGLDRSGEAGGLTGLIIGAIGQARIKRTKTPEVSGPSGQPPTQLGGIKTEPANPNDPQFDETEEVDVVGELAKVQQRLSELQQVDPTRVSPKEYAILKGREGILLGMQPKIQGQVENPNVPAQAISDATTTYETVTPEELQAFRQGQIDPERAAAIADDVALIQSGQMDINSIDDPNYRLMVESVMGAGQQGQGTAQNVSLENKVKETESKIKNKGLFLAEVDENGNRVVDKETGRQSQSVGEIISQSDDAPVPTSVREINGIEFVEFSNPRTGDVDVIVTGKNDGSYVGYYRLYDNGKPTNQWSSKFENPSRNKEDFKTMISGVQSMLPEGHEYTEKTSISTDGLRVWEQQLGRGYELQTDENGNIITNKVAINGDAIVNELGIDVDKGSFENISVRNNTDIKKVRQALLPYLQKLGLNESNIYFENGTAYIDLPVLKKKNANATPQSETIVANQAAQNMGTAVNQPLETGAAAVEVGESGRPVVEVEGDQVVEEEKPVEGYDFAKAFEPLTKEEQEKADKERLDDEANEKQRLFDKAGFDKSWAKDYDEAKTKLIDQYNKAKEKKEKAQAKVIKKSGGKTVFVGDEVGGVNVSVDRINEKNRLQDIAIAEKDMAEAVKDLAKLGVKEADLLPSQKNVKSSEKAEAPKSGSVGVGGKKDYEMSSSEYEAERQSSIPIFNKARNIANKILNWSGTDGLYEKYLNSIGVKDKDGVYEDTSINDIDGYMKFLLKEKADFFTKEDYNTYLKYQDFMDRGIDPDWSNHKTRVSIALSEGKKVPNEVLKEYPELSKEQSLKEAPKANKTSPLAPFQTKDKEGQAARAALKESVGPKEFKRLENIAKNGEKILRDLESRNVLKIDCP